MMIANIAGVLGYNFILLIFSIASIVTAKRNKKNGLAWLLFSIGVVIQSISLIGEYRQLAANDEVSLFYNSPNIYGFFTISFFTLVILLIIIKEKAKIAEKIAKEDNEDNDNQNEGDDNHTITIS